MIGKTISHYKILEKLGEGGMGVVYKAQDTKLKRTVALKFLPSELTRDPEAKERFVREAQAASALDHPYIGTIYEIDETPTLIDPVTNKESRGQLFIAMACYEGETLKQKIEKGPLKMEEAIEFATQVAEGLAKAHEHGIIHRDIKPANVMVTQESRVKILDFGLAKSRLAGSHLTKAGTMLGTVAYMSPEQARGAPVDERTDIWALGVVLYEMLTGQRPFQGDYEQAVLYSILNEDPEPITALRADLSSVLGGVVRKALEKNPARRYPNMRAVLEDLETVSSKETAAPEPEKSIVVLPFTNLSPDPDDAYFSDGLTEELITDLSRISELRVISSASAFRLKETDKELRAIGRELQVRYAVAGRVRKAGQSVRITAQLIDLRDDSSVWADKYSGSLENVFDLQEQVSRAIADALHVKLRPPSRAPKPEAAEAYLKGRHFFRQATTDGLKKALECFRNASEIDPNYAPAFAGLANTYVHLTAGWEALPAHDTMPRAETAARRAFELDPTLPEAHVAHGVVATYHHWDLATAEGAFRAALRLNPNYAEAHGWYTAPLIWLDTRFAQALEHARRAVELNPVDPWSWFQLACTHYFSRDFEGAINQSRQLINIEPMWGRSCGVWMKLSRSDLRRCCSI